jgi:YHS domain-containing protein
MRQIGKQILTIMAVALMTLGVDADEPVTDIVTDPLTGVAIEGYDPVTYFTDSEPKQGTPDFEHVWSGVSWYFVSAANRDVFARNPPIYAPQYGGHCVMSLSRGYLSDGKPRLYSIEGLRLYFFYSTANRDAFLMSKTEAVTKAEANWGNLSNGLPGVGEKPAVVETTGGGTEGGAPVAPATAGDNVAAH